MKSAAPAGGKATRVIAGLAIGLLLAAGVGAWWFIRHRDPFARLADQDHDTSLGIQESHVLSTNAVPVADQFRQLDERLRVDPRNPALLAAKIHLGLEYDPGKALEECRRVLAESPRNYFALHHAAMACLATTNLDRALYYAAGALQVKDTPEAHFVAGHIFYAKGDFPKALKHYRAASAGNPGDDAARHFVTNIERAIAAEGVTSQATRTINVYR